MGFSFRGVVNSAAPSSPVLITIIHKPLNILLLPRETMEFWLSKLKEYFLSKVKSRVTGVWELPSDLDRLRKSLPDVNRLMDKAEWWRFKDPYIADLLVQLRDATYDAEDVISEFDYYQLQHKIEGQNTSQLSSSLGSFIKDLVNNSASKVKNVQTNLDAISGKLKSVIDPLRSPDGPNPYGKTVQNETSSLITEPVLGREEEAEMVVKLMLQPGYGVRSSNKASSSSSGRAKRRKTCNFSVLPIVGIGGIGKTTLAQLIYNDDRVGKHFDLKIWVCVSDYFDLKKITREMIESTNRAMAEKDEDELMNNEKQVSIGENLTNLDSLQQILKRKVASRRYLIVLDDVWHDKTREWENLSKPLGFGLEGSMILITTRISKVADVAGTMDPIKLGGLPKDIYWELFKKCVFGSDNTSSYPELEGIGKKIVAKLNGSPLAAKTLGGMLCKNMTSKHWSYILESELWQLEQDDDAILPALRVSYQYLPIHLKRCFLICSLFPKDFELDVDRLSPVWMADGIISHEKNISSAKGKEYFNEIENMSLIIRGQNETNSLHDLMHDLAKSLSLNTCYCQEENNWSLENHNTVRHLSVYRKPIEFIDKEISRCHKLRSLLFLESYPIEFQLGPSTLASLLNQLRYLRLLDLSFCKIEELPEDIGNLKLLFYINLSGTKIKSLPDSICQLYNLQVVNVDACRELESFPKMFHNLINLRLITEWMEISSKIPGIGRLTSLEKLPGFEVLNKHGHKIEELSNMTRLQGHLRIRNLENVESVRDATQACLNKKEHLTGLTLSWSLSRSTNTVVDDDIIEGLEPHPNLEVLTIENYGGRTLASWFVPHQLLSLQALQIRDCVNLVSLPFEWISSSSITYLEIINSPLLNCPSNLILPSTLLHLELISCGELDMSLPRCLENLYSLNYLELQSCQHVTSLPSQVTSNLNKLTLINCAELQCLELGNPSIMEKMYINKCPKLIQYDPSTTYNEGPVERITNLYALIIDNTSFLKLPFLRKPPRSLHRLVIWGSLEEKMFTKDIQGWLNVPENLEDLIFGNCPNLESLPEELHTLATVKMISIKNCPKIQSLPENGLPPLLNDLYFEGCHPALTDTLRKRQIEIYQRQYM